MVLFCRYRFAACQLWWVKSDSNLNFIWNLNRNDQNENKSLTYVQMGQSTLALDKHTRQTRKVICKQRTNQTDRLNNDSVCVCVYELMETYPVNIIIILIIIIIIHKINDWVCWMWMFAHFLCTSKIVDRPTNQQTNRWPTTKQQHNCSIEQMRRRVMSARHDTNHDCGHLFSNEDDRSTLIANHSVDNAPLPLNGLVWCSCVLFVVGHNHQIGQWWWWCQHTTHQSFALFIGEQDDKMRWCPERKNKNVFERNERKTMTTSMMTTMNEREWWSSPIMPAVRINRNNWNWQRQRPMLQSNGDCNWNSIMVADQCSPKKKENLDIFSIDVAMQSSSRQNGIRCQIGRSWYGNTYYIIQGFTFRSVVVTSSYPNWSIDLSIPIVHDHRTQIHINRFDDPIDIGFLLGGRDRSNIFPCRGKGRWWWWCAWSEAYWTRLITCQEEKVCLCSPMFTSSVLFEIGVWQVKHI